jgi:hypothetical protein
MLKGLRLVFMQPSKLPGTSTMAGKKTASLDCIQTLEQAKRLPYIPIAVVDTGQ